MMMWEELNANLSTKEHVLEMAFRDKSNFIAVGMHGRKGPKEYTF
jgi:hypothetical protein